MRRGGSLYKTQARAITNMSIHGAAMTSTSRLSHDERALISDIALLKEAAESARNIKQ
jgi:hypothetical protein